MDRTVFRGEGSQISRTMVGILRLLDAYCRSIDT